MDVASYLQRFESSLGSYTGDDPLEPWDKFVEYLEQRVPAGGMSQVLDSLVQRFLKEERYANDVRYVNYCIRCAGHYSDPAAMFSYVHGQGVGSTSAALYVAWARALEQRGMHQQAEAVYQTALGNRAQPADAVLGEHRQFQTRTRSQATASRSSNPLQDSLLTNQLVSLREPSAAQDPLDGPPKPAAHKTTVIVSRSETSGMIRSRPAPDVPTVSAYMTEELACEGSELCFEEVRAEKYFRKLREDQAMEVRETAEKMLSKMGEGILAQKSRMEKLHHDLQALRVQTATGVNPDSTQQHFGRPDPTSSRRSHREAFVPEAFVPEAFVPEAFVPEAFVPEAFVPEAFVPEAFVPGVFAEKLRRQHEYGSAGTPSSAFSHHAPHPADEVLSQPPPTNQQTRSDQQPFGFELHGGVPWQDDRVLPRSAEFSAALPDAAQPEEERLNESQVLHNLSHITPNNSLGFVQATPSRVLPSPTVNTREALDVIMDMFQAPTLLEDPLSNPSLLHMSQSHAGFTGNGCSSTPFNIFQDETDKENGGAAAPAERSKPIRALAEIPAANKPTVSQVEPDESTMWGARYNSLSSLAACPNSTSDFAMLAQFVSTPFSHKAPFSFYEEGRDDCHGGELEDDAFSRRKPKKLSPIMEQSPSNDAAFSQQLPASAAHGTIVGEGLAPPPHCLTSSITMVQAPPPAVLSFRDQTPSCPTDWDVYSSPAPPPQREPFTIMEDLDRPSSPDRVLGPLAGDVPMSPEGAVPADWLAVQTPEPRVEPDLDVFLSPRRLGEADPGVPMSPQQLRADVPMSPMQSGAEDEPMTSSDAMGGESMNPAAPVQLVADPWDEELISRLLSALRPPLASHPRCVSWPCRVPDICPKTTISMGNSSLRVDCVLGEGAFATVYQATDPVTSARTALKVQRPASPWEFYINVQLDARLRPDVRHLFSAISSAHLFQDGSVLLSELHNHGTLLNAVNMYKTLGDKVMPQPLVMYFAVCILHMVEQLHAVHVIHADIKPDNFLLGERFLDNKCLDPENLDHGLVLVDLGQSIDMELFPEGTAFTAKCLTSGFQCTEMLSGKPWSYQTDYFGLAGTVHCMLFGTYMQVKNEDGEWKTNGVFRRNPHSDLWQDFFHALLNVPAAGAPPSLRRLRCSLAAALKQNYGNKLPTLKSRLMVLLLENRRAARR